MKRGSAGLAGIGVLGALGFFTFAPGYVDAGRNQTYESGPWTVSPEQREAHDRLTVVDLHTDSLLWDRDLSRRGRGHADLPRLRDAGMAIQAFTIVSKTPKDMNFDHNTGDTDNIQLLMFGQLRWPDTWFSLEARAHSQAAALAALEDEHFRVIRGRVDLELLLRDRKQRDPTLLGGLIGVEGAHCLQGDLAAVDRLFESGIRMMAPVHFFDNEVGSSAHGVSDGGLTDFGRQVIQRQEELGIAVDLAHASPKLVDDVLAMASKPVLVSHTGVRGTCDRKRNLSDEQLRGVARTGGVVGIAFFEEATCGTDTDAIVRAIQHAVKVAGIDHVAFGSDFDGSVTVPWDVTGMPLLTTALREAGFSESDMEKLAGENAIRVFRKTLNQ